MSAYIVSGECMDRIISGLFNNQMLRHYGELYSEQNLIGWTDFKELAERFYKLNQDAVRQRYPDDKTDFVQIPAYSLTGNRVSNVQLLKSLQCLRYQCSEGNVPNKKLYKWLEKVIDALKETIINSMPEYEKAEWG